MGEGRTRRRAAEAFVETSSCEHATALRVKRAASTVGHEWARFSALSDVMQRPVQGPAHESNCVHGLNTIGVAL